MYASFLDNDFYKFLMSQFIWNYYPDAEVTFKFKNRSDKPLLVENKDIHNEFQKINNLMPTRKEFDYLFSIPFTFSRNYLKELFSQNSLQSTYQEFNISESTFYITGPWWLVTLIETPLLASISELHTKSIINNVSEFVRKKIEEQNDANLMDFINKVNRNRSIRFNDFGTRRRYSFAWQEKVLKTCSKYLDDEYKLAGTSNVHLAKIHNLNPIGTFAHELPMGIAGYLENLGLDKRNAYKELMDKWKSLYHNRYSILLTDTFTTDWLFKNHGEEVVKDWYGVRQDSGDPFEFGEKYINLCEKYNVESMKRVIVFSDGLTAEKIEEILEYFRGRVWCAFGIGTNLTNNTEIRRPNIVLKVRRIRNNEKTSSVAKLSDEKGKNTGDETAIEKYKLTFNI